MWALQGGRKTEEEKKGGGGKYKNSIPHASPLASIWVVRVKVFVLGFKKHKCPTKSLGSLHTYKPKLPNQTQRRDPSRTPKQDRKGEFKERKKEKGEKRGPL